MFTILEEEKNATLRIIAGMPHLDTSGISELWLLSTAGHLHWSLLENQIGMRSRFWVNKQGLRCYATFVYSRVEYEDCRGTESDDIVMSSQLVAHEPPFAVTRAEIAANGRRVASVELLSATIVRVFDWKSQLC